MKIRFTTTPQSSDIDFLTQKINEATPQFGAAAPFAFFIRDESGSILAGCNGSLIFGAIYTDQLWVDEHHRQLGLGKHLMEAVHAYGKQNGCTMATVNTMSFQRAKGFYEKLGYKVTFERPGYNQNATCLFMQKAL
jgi:ribosomal protein S18 acetylase RimI-like enzyme